jgi:SOS-response transcriptional repressor LexA
VNFAATGTENVFETNSIQPKNVFTDSPENISPTPFIDLKNQAFVEYLPFTGEVAAGIPMHELDKTYQFSEEAFKSGSKSEGFLGKIDIDWIKCPERFIKNRRFVVKVTGDSMEPLCSIGDYLICEYHRHVQSGRNVVIMANFADLPDIGECAVKRIKESEDSWIFMSDNKKYDDIKVPKDDINPEYPIYGTVIYNLTKEKEIR